jgi:hypothetical protein
MSYMVRQFSATIPMNTPLSAPVTVNLATGWWQIDVIDLEVPPGPAGLMGFQLWIGGGQWIPFEPGEYLVWDDIQNSWVMTDQPLGQQWSIVGYNEDDFNDHAVTVRFHISQVAAPAPSMPSITFVSTPTPSQPVLL